MLYGAFLHTCSLCLTELVQDIFLKMKLVLNNQISYGKNNHFSTDNHVHYVFFVHSIDLYSRILHPIVNFDMGLNSV